MKAEVLLPMMCAFLFVGCGESKPPTPVVPNIPADAPVLHFDSSVVPGTTQGINKQAFGATLEGGKPVVVTGTIKEGSGLREGTPVIVQFTRKAPNGKVGIYGSASGRFVKSERNGELLYRVVLPAPKAPATYHLIVGAGTRDFAFGKVVVERGARQRPP